MNQQDYSFAFVLMDRMLAEELIMNLHKSEPSGYGTFPPQSMNLVYGVQESTSGVFVTQGFEEDSRQWRGKEGDHEIIFDVKCPEGFFQAYFDTNAYGDYWQYARFNSCNASKYTELVRKAIAYYMHDGRSDYSRFRDTFEETHGISIYEAQRNTFNQICEDYKRKWKM